MLDAKSYVIEKPYIDRDYSADYAYFYARTFRSHERYCKRIHFFSDDISPVLRRPVSTEQLERIKDFTRTNLLRILRHSSSGKGPNRTNGTERAPSRRIQHGSNRHLSCPLQRPHPRGAPASHRNSLSTAGLPRRRMRSSRNLGWYATHARETQVQLGFGIGHHAIRPTRNSQRSSITTRGIRSPRVKLDGPSDNQRRLPTALLPTGGLPRGHFALRRIGDPGDSWAEPERGRPRSHSSRASLRQTGPSYERSGEIHPSVHCA